MTLSLTSHLCGTYPTATPRINPMPIPMAISMGPCMAFVSQLPGQKQRKPRSSVIIRFDKRALGFFFFLPWENIILRHTPNAEMQNMSSKLHAAITSVMIPLSSPRPLCLKSNSAGRMTAELTGLRIHLFNVYIYILYMPRTGHVVFDFFFYTHLL